MRLIDADELKINIYHDCKDALTDELVQCIDNTKTAYDVENVVEQLEENQKIEMHFDGTKPKQYIDFTKAVEIVKGGGVNE